jgi:hypothetical protein
MTLFSQSCEELKNVPKAWKSSTIHCIGNFTLIPCGKPWKVHHDMFQIMFCAQCFFCNMFLCMLFIYILKSKNLADLLLIPNLTKCNLWPYYFIVLAMSFPMLCELFQSYIIWLFKWNSKSSSSFCSIYFK